MQELVFIIHILAAVFLVILILMQHGKGADMGAAFGSGASQTVFGSVGSMPFLTKVTATVAVIFFATSIGLGYFISKMGKQESSISAIPTTVPASTTQVLPQQPQPTSNVAPDSVETPEASTATTVPEQQAPVKSSDKTKQSGKIPVKSHTQTKNRAKASTSIKIPVKTHAQRTANESVKL